MDKLLTALLSPFAGRLIATVSLASTVFWAVGLVVLGACHPQPLPACASGGGDLCGVLSGHWAQAVVPALFFFGGVFVVSTVILSFPRWTLEALSGRGWWWRVLGRACQDRARTRHAASATRRRQHRSRWYPHGVPWNYPAYLLLPTDVPLEPTRLANVFAATQQRILSRHGLWMSSCQWLLLEVSPPEKKAEFEQLSQAVLRRVHALEWFVLTTAWAYFLPAAGARVAWVLVCLAAAHWAYREVCRAAAEYCEVLDATVTTHRMRLYRAAGFPLPQSTSEELAKGHELSAYLDRSRPTGHVEFVWPDAAG
ncbi:hypothetical protein ACGFMK_13385 [Amycolatopsis sp. NPDC049252]|uniref:hypothetical protein n=1 Tax=Amycolatopsis sp. NPDC049252 TaxID=3363933 RepID=UPI00371085F2